MDKSTREVRYSQWSKIVKAANNRPAGMFLKDWLDEQGISRDQYFYWQRKVRNTAYDLLKEGGSNSLVPAVSFAEISLPSTRSQSITCGMEEMLPTVATIQTDGIRIELSNHVSLELVREIVKAVTSHA